MFKVVPKTLAEKLGDGGSDTAVLFVHGLGGGQMSWKPFTDQLAKQWEEADSFALEYDHYYGTQGLVHKIPLLRGVLRFAKVLLGPDLDRLSAHLRSTVDVLCDRYDHVIIVAHSMGGLIARKYIVDLFDDMHSAGKIKCLITYATPHQGSVWANHYLVFLSPLLRPLIRDAHQIVQLSKGNSFLDELNKKWSVFRIDDKIDFKRVVGLEDWIVDPDSSSYLDDKKSHVVASKGHFSILRPTGNKDVALMVTYNYLRKFRMGLAEQMDREIEMYDDLASDE